MGTWFPTYSQAPVVPVRQAALTVSMCTALLAQNGVAMGTPPHTPLCEGAGVPLISLQLYVSKELSGIVFLAGDQ